MKVNSKCALLVLALAVAIVMSSVAETACAATDVVTIVVTKQGTQFKVRLPGQQAVAADTLALESFQNECDTTKYLDSAAQSITIINTVWPVSSTTKTTVNVNNLQTSSPTKFCVPTDVGTWVFTVGDGPAGDPDATLTIIVTSEVPTLSEWALIIFGVLLLGLMTFYVVRRRRTAHAAAF